MSDSSDALSLLLGILDDTDETADWGLHDPRWRKLLRDIMAERDRLRAENACYKGMKAGVAIRIADLEAERDQAVAQLKLILSGMQVANAIITTIDTPEAKR